MVAASPAISGGLGVCISYLFAGSSAWIILKKINAFRVFSVKKRRLIPMKFVKALNPKSFIAKLSIVYLLLIPCNLSTCFLSKICDF